MDLRAAFRRTAVAQRALLDGEHLSQIGVGGILAAQLGPTSGVSQGIG